MLPFGLAHLTRASSVSPRNVAGMTSPTVIHDSVADAAVVWKLP